MWSAQGIDGDVRWKICLDGTQNDTHYDFMTRLQDLYMPCFLCGDCKCRSLLEIYNILAAPWRSYSLEIENHVS
jgi:hypothetical protein